MIYFTLKNKEPSLGEEHKLYKDSMICVAAWCCTGEFDRNYDYILQIFGFGLKNTENIVLLNLDPELLEKEEQSGGKLKINYWTTILAPDWIILSKDNFYENSINGRNLLIEKGVSNRWFLQVKKRDRKNITEFYNHDLQDFTFLVCIQNKNDHINGYMLDLPQMIDVRKITKEYCSEASSSKGKKLGVTCPLNLNSEQMAECLNWRRKDQIGVTCRSVMSEAEKHYSADKFCSEINREDCQCYNRTEIKEYVANQKYRKFNDYCWWKPCSSNAYLRPKHDVIGSCEGINYCENIFEVHGEKSTTLHNINAICNIDSTYEENKTSSILVIVVVLLILLIVI